MNFRTTQRRNHRLADALASGGSSGVASVRRWSTSDKRRASASTRTRQERGGCAQSLCLIIAALFIVRARIGPPCRDHAPLGFVEEGAPKIGANGIRCGASGVDSDSRRKLAATRDCPGHRPSGRRLNDREPKCDDLCRACGDQRRLRRREGLPFDDHSPGGAGDHVAS